MTKKLTKWFLCNGEGKPELVGVVGNEGQPPVWKPAEKADIELWLANAEVKDDQG